MCLFIFESPAHPFTLSSEGYLFYFLVEVEPEAVFWL